MATFIQLGAATAALTALGAQAVLTTAGCANLEGIFVAFGFTAATTGSTASITGCGCTFALTIPTGSAASATCSGTSVVSLALTNNALTGSALIFAEDLPPLTSSLDISENPDLSQWPTLDNVGNVPVLSFTILNQTGDAQLCCPSATITCTPTTAVCTSATAAGSSSSSTSLTVNSDGGVVAYTIGTYSPIPYISSLNAPGTIFVIILGVCVFIGGTILATVMWYTRKTQKPVKLDDSEFELDRGKTPA
ncbi:hypothetical protein HK100_000553 [Physocladia obscura]|uniref:Uncharacterized protein n=1 Tax=Physocladia obscura TaxID=109957 RepID=A0AAD5T8S4_9FUNG|nr:hypothetical protein HK100_000553 [Physocladia obscura]